MTLLRYFFAVWVTIPTVLCATPVPLLNPSGEINNGIDRTAIPDVTFPGWGGDERGINPW
jgi:hypothetical protein